jgi:hypothetical protein
MAKATIANGTNGIEPTGAIHLTLQGKGGVGKSLVASVLAQYLREIGKEVRCIDTDPVNRTFAQYTALGADRLNLRDEHNRIEQRAFDSLIERFLTEDTATFVVDNGASTFLPLWNASGVRSAGSGYDSSSPASGAITRGAKAHGGV